MSATQSRLGPPAEKSRFTRSGAGLASASLFVVPVSKRLRVTPWMPSSLIRRATRLRLTRTPSSSSAAWIRGQPYVLRLSTQISMIWTLISSSRRDLAEGRRRSQP